MGAHRQCKISVMAGIDAYEFIRTMGCCGFNGIDGDDLRTVFFRPLYPPPAVRMGEHRIRAPHDHHRCVHHAVRLVAVTPIARAEHAINAMACGVIVASSSLDATDASRQAREQTVYAVDVSVIAGSSVEHDRRPAVLIDSGLHVRGDLLNSLIPANSLPFTCAALGALYTTHGILNSRLTVNALDIRKPLQATACIPRLWIITRFELNEPPVSNMRQKATRPHAV